MQNITEQGRIQTVLQELALVIARLTTGGGGGTPQSSPTLDKLFSLPKTLNRSIFQAILKDLGRFGCSVKADGQHMILVLEPTKSMLVDRTENVHVLSEPLLGRLFVASDAPSDTSAAPNDKIDMKKTESPPSHPLPLSPHFDDRIIVEGELLTGTLLVSKDVEESKESQAATARKVIQDAIATSWFFVPFNCLQYRNEVTGILPFQQRLERTRQLVTAFQRFHTSDYSHPHKLYIVEKPVYPLSQLPQLLKQVVRVSKDHLLLSIPLGPHSIGVPSEAGLLLIDQEQDQLYKYKSIITVDLQLVSDIPTSIGNGFEVVSSSGRSWGYAYPSPSFSTAGLRRSSIVECSSTPAAGSNTIQWTILKLRDKDKSRANSDAVIAESLKAIEERLLLPDIVRQVKLVASQTVSSFTAAQQHVEKKTKLEHGDGASRSDDRKQLEDMIELWKSDPQLELEAMQIDPRPTQQEFEAGWQSLQAQPLAWRSSRRSQESVDICYLLPLAKNGNRQVFRVSSTVENKVATDTCIIKETLATCTVSADGRREIKVNLKREVPVNSTDKAKYIAQAIQTLYRPKRRMSFVHSLGVLERDFTMAQQSSASLPEARKTSNRLEIETELRHCSAAHQMPTLDLCTLLLH
jgi:hypothetical protein